jgi:hypothetical protein
VRALIPKGDAGEHQEEEKSVHSQLLIVEQSIQNQSEINLKKIMLSRCMGHILSMARPCITLNPQRRKELASIVENKPTQLTKVTVRVITQIT